MYNIIKLFKGDKKILTCGKRKETHYVNNEQNTVGQDL